MLISPLIAALACTVLATPVPLTTEEQHKRSIPASHALHERHLPLWETQWTKRTKVPASQVLPMRIGLKQMNLEAGHDRLMEM